MQCQTQLSLNRDARTDPELVTLDGVYQCQTQFLVTKSGSIGVRAWEIETHVSGKWQSPAPAAHYSNFNLPRNISKNFRLRRINFNLPTNNSKKSLRRLNFNLPLKYFKKFSPAAHKFQFTYKIPSFFRLRRINFHLPFEIFKNVNWKYEI